MEGIHQESRCEHALLPRHLPPSGVRRGTARHRVLRGEAHTLDARSDENSPGPLPQPRGRSHPSPAGPSHGRSAVQEVEHSRGAGEAGGVGGREAVPAAPVPRFRARAVLDGALMHLGEVEAMLWQLDVEPPTTMWIDRRVLRGMWPPPKSALYSGRVLPRPAA